MLPFVFPFVLPCRGVPISGAPRRWPADLFREYSGHRPRRVFVSRKGAGQHGAGGKQKDGESVPRARRGQTPLPCVSNCLPDVLGHAYRLKRTAVLTGLPHPLARLLRRWRSNALRRKTQGASRSSIAASSESRSSWQRMQISSHSLVNQ